MPLTAGTRLGVYEVVAAIGAGGMGEVYRAHDTKLNRDVALKVLPELFAGDADRLARFRREAQVLASLNHSNIAQIYGFAEADGTSALAMEFVAGADLSERLATGPLPTSDALAIAQQIAEALEAAHESGIIHRDLKPANVKVRDDGTVKVLDFGLAKALGAELASAVAGVTQSPTLTTPAMTAMGMILGTAAYMSPEQAKGRPADRRSDIWAFGCVLFEMLTAKRAFPGEDVSETLASVLAREPDWNALPANLPPALRTLIERCLIKDPRQRITHVAAVRYAMSAPTNLLKADVAAGTSSVQAEVDKAVAETRRALVRSGRRRLALVAAGLLVAGAASTAAVWWTTRPAPPRVTRFRITPEASASPFVTPAGSGHDLAITPDGSRIVYTTLDGALVVWALDQLEPTLIGVRGARSPFISPNGQWIGFFEGGQALKKVSIAGGPASLLCPLDGVPRGAAWLPNGTIVFATNNSETGLIQVSEAGGAVTVLTRPDPASGEDHVWPESLPDGRSLLFTIVTAAGPDSRQVALFDVATGTQSILIPGGSHAHYVSSGHLAYAAGGALWAVPFDLKRRTVAGTGQPVVNSVLVSGQAGALGAVIASDGTLVYLPPEAAGLSNALSLVWVDRSGREEPVSAPKRAYQHVRLNRDDTRVATFVSGGTADIWVLDLASTTAMKLTDSPVMDSFPVWLPDSIVFSSQRQGPRRLFKQPVDSAGRADPLSDSPNRQDANSLTPDGRLVFTEYMSKTADDVMMMTLDDARQVVPLVQTPAGERNGEVSPDGRWLAYQANPTGTWEIYVRPFPETTRDVRVVSAGGGTRPLWSRNGRELFYMALDGALLGVSVGPGPQWTPTRAKKILEPRYFAGNDVLTGRTYDVARDGRFLMIKNDAADATSAPVSFVVVQHFDEELKARVR